MNIACITARIGSKEIYQKNIKSFCGRPLSFWVLNELQKSDIDLIYFLTDSFKIAHIVRDFNLDKVKIELVPEMPEMGDTSMTDDIIHKFFSDKERSLLYRGKSNNLLIAQVTSPLTTYKDYNSSFQIMKEGEYDTVISVTQGIRFFWDKEKGEPINHPRNVRYKRQTYQNNVIENGAFYLTDFDMFMDSKYRSNGKIGFHIMPDYSAYEIDSVNDWDICEGLYKKYIDKSFINKNIKLFASDIDGVFTDGNIYMDNHGNESKKFNVKDGHGLFLLKEMGIKMAILTSGDYNIHTQRFLKKTVKVDYLIQKSYNKLESLKQICELEKIPLSEVCYIGDDIIDSEVLLSVGLAACPSDAVDKVKKLEGVNILTKKGGEGCVRELIDNILG